MPVTGDELGCGLGDERLEDGVDLGDLGLERHGAAGESPQRELGERAEVATPAGPVGAGAFEEPVDVEVAELGADRLGGGGDDRRASG